MEEGQAAGTAAVLSLRAKVSFPDFTEDPGLVHELQAALHTQGQYLLPETLAAALGVPTHQWPGTPRSPVKPPVPVQP